MQKRSLEAAVDQLVEDSRSLWVPNRVSEYDSKGESLQFLRDHVSQSVPCVWRGAATSWPAVTKWSGPSQRYLRNKIGDRLVQVAWTPDGRADSIVDLVSSEDTPPRVFAMPQQREQKFGDMLSQLRGCETNCGLSTGGHVNQVADVGVPYYSAQDSNLTRKLPELMEDIDESIIDFATEAFGEEACATNIWCGDARSVTTMHSDPFENLYAVVTGVKIFRLRPPCDAATLHKPLLRRAKWEMVKAGDNSETARVLRPKREYDGWRLVEEERTTNWVDEDSIDDQCGHELVVRIEAGDLLYLPAMWFHRVSQYGLTIAVNWWFEMKFGQDYMYRELCLNLHDVMSASKKAEIGSEQNRTTTEDISSKVEKV